MRTTSRLFIPFSALTLLAAASVAAGCASAPARPAAGAQECSQLAGEIADAEQSRREALERQQGAWKFVIPVAVAARYASGMAEVSEADKRLAEWRAQFEQKGCASRG